MLTKILKTIEENNMLVQGERVLCALSGGTDSSVLFDVLVKHSEWLGITVCAAHLNHMLRGEDAMRDEEFVRRKCRGYGVELICERIDVAEIAKVSGQSTELAARNVRYDFLRRASKSLGASKIATAHNANDNLETILFNLSRGSGIDGLCGIPPVRNDIIRPLIAVTRCEIEEYARINGIEFCEDKTNSDTVYSRNKLRHEAIPAIVGVNSGAVRNAARLSQILRRDSELLRSIARDAAKDIAIDASSCPKDKLLSLHESIFARVCEFFARSVLGDENYTLEFRHIADIRRLCESKSPSNEIHLPSGLTVRREYERLVFEKRTDNTGVLPMKLDLGEMVYGNYTVSVKKSEKIGKIHNSVNTFFVPYDRIQGDLVIRGRREGDEIKLPKRPRKSLKKLFVDERVPKTVRSSVPIIADDEKIFGVFGFGQDERYLPDIGDNVLIIEI